MGKTFFCLAVSLICTTSTFAQSEPLAGPVRRPDTTPHNETHTSPTVADKTRVMELFQNQQFDDAISYLRPSLGDDSANTTVLGYLGYAYYMMDNTRDAENCYQKIFALDSANTSALRYLEALHQHDDPDGALIYTNHLLTLQPDHAIWWRTKGELLRRMKQPQTALTCLQRAYTLAPEEVKNIAALADILIENKEYPHADSILDLGLVKDSLNFTLLKLRQRSAYNAKDYATAIIPGEKILAMNLPDVNSQTWLGLSHYNLQHYSDCIRACQFLLNNGYDIEPLYYYISRSMSKLKNYSGSNMMLQVCLKKSIEPTTEWYYNGMADNYEALKDYKQAIAALDTAYYLYKDPLTLYNSGRMAETGLHNKTLARQYFTRYLAVAHPETPEEKKVYAYIRSRWGHSATGKHPAASSR